VTRRPKPTARTSHRTLCRIVVPTAGKQAYPVAFFRRPSARAAPVRRRPTRTRRTTASTGDLGGAAIPPEPAETELGRTELEAVDADGDAVVTPVAAASGSS
jgi:hypothetical protein